MEVFVVFLIWGALAIGVGALASGKGRSGFGFFLLSVFFSPLLGLIIVLVVKDLKEEERRDAARTAEFELTRERQKDHERQLESLRAITAKVSEPAKAAFSVADEIERLFDLKTKGALTEEEFQEHKRALIAKNA